MRKVVSLVYVIIVIIGLLVIGCDSDGNTPTANSSEVLEGTLPILKIGDTWTQKGFLEGSEYTSTSEVIGEDILDGVDCYVIEINTNHPVLGSLDNYSSAIVMFDKATLNTLRMQYTYEVQGELTEAVVTISEEHSESPFPFKVGKTWETVETEISSWTSMGDTRSATEKYIYMYGIEAKEMVTVPAGTFECFKLVQYDDDGSTLQTSWASDATKMINVKTYDHETDETVELISYSVSD